MISEKISFPIGSLIVTCTVFSDLAVPLKTSFSPGAYVMEDAKILMVFETETLIVFVIVSTPSLMSTCLEPRGASSGMVV